MASIKAGVGPRLGWGEVTIYIKRIGRLPLSGEPPAAIAGGSVSLFKTTNGPGANRQGFWKKSLVIPGLRQKAHPGMTTPTAAA
jgi:hypothetical protein